MFAAIKRFCKRLFRKLWSVLKKVISGALEIFLSELLDFGKNTVRNLENADLSNLVKDNEAFRLITAEANKRGIFYKANWVGILIKLALEAIRNEV